MEIMTFVAGSLGCSKKPGKTLNQRIQKIQNLRWKYTNSFPNSTRDPGHSLSVSVDSLSYLMHDESPAVVKKVISTTTVIYSCAFSWACALAPHIAQQHQTTWEKLRSLKAMIVEKSVDSQNDGVRTMAMKFVEMVILASSHRASDLSVAGKGPEIDDVPPMHPFLNSRTLNDEVNIFRLEICGFLSHTLFLQAMHLGDFLGTLATSGHPTASNLVVLVPSLGTLARVRPREHLVPCAGVLFGLANNLPVHLTVSQRDSVKKQLKLQLMGLLVHADAVDLVPRITQVECKDV